MRWLGVILACALSVSAQTTITWQQITNQGIYPGAVGWTSLNYDPVSGKVIHFAVPNGSVSIYSTSWYTYTSATQQWARLFGYDSMANKCTADKDATFPGDRHPLGNQAIDTSRNRLWFWGGVNTTCDQTLVDTNGTAVTWTGTGTRNFHSSYAGENVVINGVTYTVASVTDSTHLTLTAGAGTQTGATFQLSNPSPNFQFMYYMNLTATPASNTWGRITVSTIPTATNGSMAYDSDADVLVYYGNAAGFPQTWVFCPANGGSLTAKQTLAGCTAQNDWALAQNSSVSGEYPPGRFYGFGMLHYVPSINRIVHFGWQDLSTDYNKTFWYNTTTRTWTEKCVSPCVNPPATPSSGYVSQAPLMYNSSTGKIIYRYKTTQTDYEYDPVADTWAALSGGGSGPVGFATGVYDATANKYIVSAESSSGNPIVLWEGTPNSSTVTGQFRILGTWPSGNVKWLEVCGIVPSLSANGTATVTLTGPGGLSIPLTVQETLYSGATGVARTNEPFCMGVPIADSSALTSTSGLALSGTATVSNTNMATDGTTISVDTQTGGCVFGVKKASTNIIDTVSCGGTAVVATSSSETRGLVLMGPDPSAGTTAGKVTCSPDSGGSACTTLYSSANDASSTCSIEKNGPIAVVVKCTGTHKTSGGSPYMQFTTRTYFWRGKTGVKVTSILRNANLDTSASPSPDRGSGAFNTAFKGFKSYELRVSPSITGTLNYTIAGHAGNQTGTVSQSGGTDDAYLYQGISLYLWSYGTCSADCLDSFTDSVDSANVGYRIVKNGSSLANGTDAVNNAVPGWADIADSAGKGVTIGIPYMSAYFPKSLEFTSGGADVRIGIWPRMNTVPVYQAWPQWDIHDLYLNFHSTSVTASNARDEFLRYQYPLVARAARTHYNSAGVFPFPINDPAQEDAYYLARESVSNPAIGGYCSGTTDCSPDYSSYDSTLVVPRYHVWSAGGGGNQEEFRWANLLKFLQRGYTGRLLSSGFFYKHFAAKGWPHADGTTSSSSTVNGFTWRSRPDNWDANYELEWFGRPRLYDSPKAFTVLNETQTFANWMDFYHNHWWGITDYYFLTGDETIKEAITPMKDWYLNTQTMQGMRNGTATDAKSLEAFSILRSVSIELSSSAMFGNYLRSIGDSSYSSVWAQGELNYTNLIRPDGCLSGYPSGCTAPPEVNNDEDDPPGINRKRGWPLSFGGRGNNWCATGSGNTYRSLTAFQAGMLVEGLLMTRWARGSAWSYYKESLDLAYGVGQWATNELFSDNGSTDWYDSGTTGWYNGFRYGVFADKTGTCPGGTSIVPGSTRSLGSDVVDENYSGINNATVWPNFYVQYLVTGSTSWARKFNLAMDRLVGPDPNAPDKGGYKIALLIDAIQNPTTTPLRNITPSIVDNGGGSYTLTWTPLSGTTSHRVKWSTLQIVDWIGYDVMAGSFTGNPDTQDNWFAAVDGGDPTCTSTCSITIATGQTGLTAQNFSVRAYATEAAESTYGTRMSGSIRVSGSARVQ